MTGSTATFRRAIAWAFMMYWGQRGITTVVTFVLAAILGPEAFGVVVLAMVYVVFVQVVLEQGFASAIIQRDALEEGHIDSAFWMNLVGAVLLGGATVATASWWAGVNDLPELAPVMMVLATLLPIRGLTIVQEALLRREMAYRSLALRSNAGALAGGGLGVGLAIGGFGVWAIVAQQIAAAFVAMVLLWSVSGWRPRFRFSPAHARDLFGFSFKVFAARIGVFLEGKIDVFVMGVFFGPAAVGLFRLASRIVETVVHLATHPAANVTLPHMARTNASPDAAAREMTRCLRSGLLFTLPALAAVAVLGEDLLTMLGEQWAPAGAALQLLCVVGALRALIVITSQMFQAAGRPGWHVALSWTATLAGAAIFTATGAMLVEAPAPAQAIGIAAARAALFAGLVAPMALLLVARLAEWSLREIATASAPGSVLAGVVFAVGWTSTAALEAAGLSPALRFAITATLTASAGGLGLLLIDPAARAGIGAIRERFRGTPTVADAPAGT